LKNIIVFVRAIRDLAWAIFQSEVDIVHIHFAERGSTLRKLIPIALGLMCGKTVILHAHGATYQEFYAGLPTIAQKIVGFLISRATKIIVLSKSWQKYYSSRFSLNESQAVVLYNPVEVPSLLPNRRGRQQLKFVFLGRIGKRGGALDIAKSLISFPKQDKGAFDLIEAFAALPEIDRQHVELVLAGNGELEAANALITKLELTDKITVLNWLSAQQRDELLTTADAFILPSYNEGLPMSMLESMAWGLPVIVTPVGGIPEVIIDRQNGLLVEPGNQSQLVRAMQELIRDESIRISLGVAAYRSVEHLDIHHYMKSLLHLYTSSIEASSNLERKISSNKIA
jgi:glycosyltransferase involved in cell wall biosynthesis